MQDLRVSTKRKLPWDAPTGGQARKEEAREMSRLFLCRKLACQYSGKKLFCGDQIYQADGRHAGGRPGGEGRGRKGRAGRGRGGQGEVAEGGGSSGGQG